MSFIGSSAVYADTFRAIERRLSAFTLPIKLREHLVDNPKTVADLEAHLLTLARAAMRLRYLQYGGSVPENSVIHRRSPGWVGFSAGNCDALTGVGAVGRLVLAGHHRELGGAVARPASGWPLAFVVFCQKTVKSDKY